MIAVVAVSKCRGRASCVRRFEAARYCFACVCCSYARFRRKHTLFRPARWRPRCWVCIVRSHVRTAASRSWLGSTRKARPGGRFAQIAVSAVWTMRPRWSAAATACSCRSLSTISAGPSAGRSPCSISRASPPRRMSNASWGYRANRSGLPAVTSSSMARSSESRYPRSGRCACWSTTAGSNRKTPRAFHAGNLAAGIDVIHLSRE